MKKYIKIKGRLAEVKAEHAKSLSRKLMGHILEPKIRPLLFEFSKERRWSFHTFFVISPIDFVFIDSEKRVVDVKYRAKPFTFCIRPKKEIKYALELPDGMGSLFKINEKLKFIQ